MSLGKKHRQTGFIYIHLCILCPLLSYYISESCSWSFYLLLSHVCITSDGFIWFVWGRSSIGHVVVLALLAFERHQPVNLPQSRNKADTCLALSLLCLYLTASGPWDGGPQGQSSTTSRDPSSINNGIKRLFYKLEGTLRDFEIKLGWPRPSVNWNGMLILFKQTAEGFISCWLVNVDAAFLPNHTC